MRVDELPLRTWLALFGAMRRYHRYEIRGLEHLLAPRRSALIVAYHGKPVTYDLAMLSVTLHEQLGHLPHGIVHGAVERQGLMKWVSDGLGFVTGDGDAVAEAVRRGELIVVQPGGTREGCRSSLHRYRVDWGERTGYLRLALRHHLPIIPVAAAGVDDGYLGLNDGYAWGKRLGVPHRLPLWIGVGPLGLWPLSPPFPVKITQLVGAPIDLEAEGAIDPDDRAALLVAHRKVAAAVQALLDARPH
jgi:1-acyl-sn-glycerol-3-phosphate acyltransferase